MLALAVRQQQSIQGILTSHLEQKILCADDAVFIMGNPENSLKELKKLLEIFGRISGYKVNELNLFGV